MSLFKEVIIKTVIYLTVEPWEEINKTTSYIKSWKKLWPIIPEQQQQRRNGGK